MKNLILIAALFVSGISSGQEELSHGDSLWLHGECVGTFDTLFSITVSDIYQNITDLHDASIPPCEDKWIEVSKHYWENCYRWEFIDSSWYYGTIEAMVNEYSKYELDSSDTGFMDWLKAKLEDN